MTSIGFVPNTAPGGPIVGRRIPVQKIQFGKMVEQGIKAGQEHTAKIREERADKEAADQENTDQTHPERLGITMGDDPPYARGPGPHRPGLPYNNPGLVPSPEAKRQWARLERLDVAKKGPFTVAPQGTAIEAHPSDRARNREPGQMTMFPDLPGEKVWKPNEAKALMAAKQKETKIRAVKSWTSRPSYRAEDQGQGALMHPKEYE
jgi:hypothetical protein